MANLQDLAAPFQGDPDKRFEAVKFLGRGSFGFVELCKDIENNNKLVCRKIAKIVDTTETEIVTLYRSKHKNIIKFYGYYIKIVDQALLDREKLAMKATKSGDDKAEQKSTMKLNDKVYCLIIEFGESGNLGKYISQRSSMEEIILLKFLNQMIQAIQFLNQNCNMHRDIKPENILLSRYGDVKLADFGTVTQIDKFATHRVFTFTQGTCAYTAPEIYYHFNFDDKYNFLVDIFSTGVVIYQACNGQISMEELSTIKDHKPKDITSEYYTSQFCQLVMSMINIDPKKRISASGILEKLNQFITPRQLNESEKKRFENALNLLNGVNGITNKIEAIKILTELSKETDYESPEVIYELAKCYFYGNGTKIDLPRSITSLRIASRKQHLQSLKMLAFCYKHGIGVEKDIFSSIQLLTIAQKIDPEVSFLLGYEYYNSKVTEINDIKTQSKLNVKRDYELSYYYFSQVKNYPPAQNYLGLCYLYGNGTETDLLEAYKYLSLSAEGGYIDGMYNLAEYYLSQKPDDESCVRKAIKLLTDAADQYHMNSAYKLSEIYKKGDIIPKDVKKASYYSKMNSKGFNEFDSDYSFALYKLNERKDSNVHDIFSRFNSILKDHPGATYQLAKFYSNGIVTKKDSGEASDLFELASENGILDATCDYALCLLRESGRPINIEKAMKLLNESSELGCRYATYLLAQCYLNGEGVKEDKVHAVELLRKAHSEGYTDATYLLAHYMRIGEGIDPNENGAKTLEESRKLFKVAVSKGHAKASYELGMIFNQDNELFVYKQKAFSLFEVAAKQEYPQALTELGIFYEYGIGVTKNYEECFNLYQKAVNLGDIKAFYHLGMCYLNGIGVEIDLEKGRSLLEEAASKGIVDAKCQLGKLYLKGISCNVDEVKAANLFEEASNNGNIESKVLLGKCLLNGIGIKIDRFKAFKLFKEAKEQNDIEGAFQLALYYMDSSNGKRANYVDATLILNELVNRNHSPSMYVLGKYYIEKGSNEEEIGDGIELLKAADKLGNTEATNYLGVCYLNGKGVSKNYQKAKKCFDDAIKNGNFYAKTNIAICYIDGIAFPEIPTDEKRGYELLLEAPKDDISAKFRIGVCLYKGIGVKQNIEEGIKLIKETAELEEMNAMCYYGKMLLKGEEVEKNENEAFRYLELASKKGQPEALYQIGLIFENGLNDIQQQNEARAQGSFRKSSDAGNSKASYHLGKIYIKDPNRKKEAIELLEKAARLKNPEAVQELERIYREGDGVEVDEDRANDYNKMASDPRFYDVQKSMLESTRNQDQKKIKLKAPKANKKTSRFFGGGGIKTLMARRVKIFH